MYFEVLADKNLGQILDVIVTLLFLVAFFLSAKNWRSSPSVFILSTILFVSFFISHNALVSMLTSEKLLAEVYYLNWLRDDAIAIIMTIAGHLILRVKVQKITALALWLLVINSATYAAMHIDIVILNNRTEPWWLWNIYSVVVNLVEFSITTLIIVYQLYMNKMEREPRNEYGI